MKTDKEEISSSLDSLVIPLIKGILLFMFNYDIINNSVYNTVKTEQYSNSS